MNASNHNVLVQRMIADKEESFGSCGRESLKIVTEVLNVYLNEPVSEAFELALEDYREQLNRNVEDATSLRLSSKLTAAQRRKQGLFFSEDPWGRALQLWIDTQPQHLPVLADLDDLYFAAPKAKPTKKWLQQAQLLFDKHGQEEVLALLVEQLEIFLSAEKISKIGIGYANEDKLKAMVMLLAISEQESNSTLLGQVATLCYSKIKYEGPVSVSVGNQCIKTLSELEGTQGLAQLSELATKIKYPQNAIKLIDKTLTEAAKRKGISKEDLQDTVVPDYGLSD